MQLGQSMLRRNLHAVCWVVARLLHNIGMSWKLHGDMAMGMAVLVSGRVGVCGVLGFGCRV